MRLGGTVEGQLVNIGAGEEFTIRHFARLICDRIGYPFEQITFDTSRYVGARSKCLSTARLTSAAARLEADAAGRGAGPHDRVVLDASREARCCLASPAPSGRGS